MTEFVKQNPDFLAATSIPTDAEIVAELAQIGARFDLVHQQVEADRKAYWSNPENPEVSWGLADDIALMRRAYETAPAFYDLVYRTIEYMEREGNG